MHRAADPALVEHPLGATSPAPPGSDILENDEPGVLVSFEMTCHLKKAGLVRFGTYCEPPRRMWLTRATKAHR
ncbi:type VI secretion protein [Burkholderia latens]|uniref:Type VI secretion protein n=1 Tax=Burkholderia latens TaxID=488446 RepID=A0A6P2IHK9_9BURK|nr:type VI secretion protein [Burkholderia latens]